VFNTTKLFEGDNPEKDPSTGTLNEVMQPAVSQNHLN